MQQAMVTIQLGAARLKSPTIMAAKTPRYRMVSVLSPSGAGKSPTTTPTAMAISALIQLTSDTRCC
jgi:hypothetical protein